jgi:acetyl-CoA carboxylase biotin carboxyl carrier protein
MDLRKLKTLIDLVSESNVSELEITEADGKVRIVKASQQASAPVMHYAVAPPPQSVPAAAATRAGSGACRRAGSGAAPRRQVTDGRHLLPFGQPG